MKPLSEDLRKLVVKADARGEKDHNIAKWFDISVSCVESILRLHRNTGSVAPKPYIGRKSSITNEMITSIKDLIKKKADSTLEEILTDLKLPIQKSQLSNLLKKLGYTYKKKRYIHTTDSGLML
jgi:transposase